MCCPSRSSQAQTQVAVIDAEQAPCGGGGGSAPIPLVVANLPPQSVDPATTGGPRSSNEAVFDTKHERSMQMTKIQAVAEPPVSAPAFQPPSALPPGWIVQTDNASGRPFFVYTPTGHTQWNPPV